jgi:glycolate oxidase FAD binding subunit
MNVITPQIVDNLPRTLARAAAENLRVSPRGGNTSTDKSLPPFDIDLNIDLTQLNHVIEYEPANLTVTVEAGMTLAALQSTLQAHRQFLPLDPPQATRATLGGIVASNAHGPLRFRYGTVRDWLIGVRVVLADGTLIRGGGRVVKNVAGYDLPKLFAGSMGTLGIIAEATFKLSPLPPASRTLIASGESVTAAVKSLLALMRWTPLPNSVELLDPALASHVLEREPDAGYALVIQCAGTSAAVTRQADDFSKLCKDLDLGVSAPLAGEPEAALWTKIRELPATLAVAEATLYELRLLPSQFEEAMSKMRTLAAAHNVQGAMFGRAGQTVWGVLTGDDDGVARTIEMARVWITAQRGYLVAQRVPPSLKDRISVWGPIRSDFGVMQRLKAQFDPQGIMNPGVFVGGV